MRSSTALSVLASCTIVGCSQRGTSSTLPAAAGNPDGQNSYAGLVAIKSTLYGTTEIGGKNGDGIVFKIAP